MPSGDSAPYAIFCRAYQFASTCPMPGEVVLLLLMFSPLKSLLLLPPLPLGSSEAPIPLKSAFLNFSFSFG